MRPLARDAHRPLMAALRQVIGLDEGAALAARLGTTPPTATTPPLLLIESMGSAPWASATFVGQTHWLDVWLEGHAAAVAATCARLGNELGEAEFAVAGHIVADVAVIAGTPVTLTADQARCHLRLEILTIED